MEGKRVAKGRLSLPLWMEQHAAPHAPATRAEMLERGWDTVDVVFVTGDAYIDPAPCARKVRFQGRYSEPT